MITNEKSITWLVFVFAKACAFSMLIMTFNVWSRRYHEKDFQYFLIGIF